MGHNSGTTSSRLNRGMTNTNTQKFNHNEINEAKESLKLLSIKMGSFGNTGNGVGVGAGVGVKTTTHRGGNDFNSNKFSNHQQMNSHNNQLKQTNQQQMNPKHNTANTYRKPFQPQFEEQENKNYHNINSKGNKFEVANNGNYNHTSKVTTSQKPMNTRLPHRHEVEEVEDDRPAFVIQDKSQE
jgi:hypothetical protein